MKKDKHIPVTEEHKRTFVEKYDRFFVEKDLSDDNDDFSSERKSIQIRLENSGGKIFISLQNGHVSTLESFTIGFDQFHKVLLGLRQKQKK